MKKLKIMIIFIILCFSFFLFSYYKKRSYKVTYKKDKYEITEKYDKKLGEYYINVKYKNNDYFFINNEDYSHKRKLVTNIKKYEYDDEVCLQIKFNGIYQSPICTKNNEYVSVDIVSKKIKNKLKLSKYKSKKANYKNINVNNYFGKKILVWNYKGFYFLSENKNKTINLFKNEIYNPTLIGQVNNYLVMADYNNSYEYNKLQVLNINNLERNILKINENYSDDSYFLGCNDKSIFMFDRKEKREFEIVPHKLKYRTINPSIYENGKLIDTTSIKLSQSDKTFTYDTMYDYQLINNNLYQTNRYNNHIVKISNQDVKEVVYKDNKNVYYIVDDKLYVYNNKYGNILLLEYFELNFNYKNIIYIFD